jgi:hypothetical protein
VEISVIVKIHKYRGFHEGHHFIPMVMAHPGMIWIVSSRNVLVFFMIGDWEVIYPCFFAFNFLGSMLIFLFNML